MDFLERQGLFLQDRRLSHALELPRGDVGVLFVVALALALFSLVFFAEVAAAAFVAVEGIESEEFAKFKEIGYTYVTLDLQGYRTGSMNETLGEAVVQSFKVKGRGHA